MEVWLSPPARHNWLCLTAAVPCAVLLCFVRQGVENKRCYELNEEEINKIREEVGKYTTEADLVSNNHTQFQHQRHQHW
jgi:ribosomal protein S13